MNESNEPISESLVATGKKESPFEPIPGQTYKTPEGIEYIVDCIARESGNIEDLFAVFKKAGGEISWVKKTSDFSGAEDFDGEFDESEIEQEETLDTVSVGQKYQHFKTKDFYLIKTLAYNRTNPKEKFVIYEGQYDSPEFGHHPIWVREYSDFAGMKEFDDGREPVKRFTLIN